MTADADEEEHGREEDRDAHVAVGHLAGLRALREVLLGLGVESLGLLLARTLVLGHVRGAGGSIRVGRGVRRQPRLERDLELGAEASLGDRHGLLVAGHVGGEPGVERRRVELERLGVLPSARSASTRAVEARARSSRDSVLHFAEA